jgi:hypothetical protein
VGVGKVEVLSADGDDLKDPRLEPSYSSSWSLLSFVIHGPNLKLVVERITDLSDKEENELAKSASGILLTLVDRFNVPSAEQTTKPKPETNS